MKKIYFVIVFTMFLGIFIGCNVPPADPAIIKDLSILNRNDFVQMKDGRLMAVRGIWCETSNPTNCELSLRTGYELTHEPFKMRLEAWAPQVEKITRYGDPTWVFLAKKYLDSQ